MDEDAAERSKLNTDQLIGLTKTIANTLFRTNRWSSVVGVDDLIQVGCIAALRSAELFNPSNGCSHKTYATIRIRGAMLDELRRNDPLSRQMRKDVRNGVIDDPVAIYEADCEGVAPSVLEELEAQETALARYLSKRR